MNCPGCGIDLGRWAAICGSCREKEALCPHDGDAPELVSARALANSAHDEYEKLLEEDKVRWGFVAVYPDGSLMRALASASAQWHENASRAARSRFSELKGNIFMLEQDLAALHELRSALRVASRSAEKTQWSREIGDVLGDVERRISQIEALKSTPAAPEASGEHGRGRL